MTALPYGAPLHYDGSVLWLQESAVPTVYVSAPPTKIWLCFVIWDRAANPKDRRPGAMRGASRLCAADVLSRLCAGPH
jgi:hypothetical protein